MKFAKDFFFEGKVPYFKYINKYLFLLALISLTIFINPEKFKDFGEAGWMLLMLIMFIKPLAMLLPKLKILKKVLILRKHLGIMCGSFIVAHTIGFLMVNNPDGIAHIQGSFLQFDSFLFWGSLGFLAALPPLLTSNTFSMKILKRHWKKFQLPAYAMFLFGILHIYFIKQEIGILLVLVAWVVLKIMQYKKVVLWK